MHRVDSLPLVAIVVLNWNNGLDTIACLRSLFELEYGNYTVLVVDNGSTDDSVAAIAAAYPDVEILQTGENLGYAGGNNVGIQAAISAGVSYVFLLNNDALIHPMSLSYLVQVALTDPSLGFLGPQVLHQEQPDRIQSAGINLAPTFDIRHLGQDQIDSDEFERPYAIDAAIGCALFLSCKAIEEAGLLDERFFLYYEEVEWCCRIRATGFRGEYVPMAKVWHRMPSHEGGKLPRITYYMTRNQYLLFECLGAGSGVYVRAVLRSLVWLLNWSINPKWAHRRCERNALVRGTIDGLTGKYGLAAI